MKKTKDKSRFVEPSDLRAPGGVHWIHARKGMEDRASWRVASLTAIGDESIDIAFAGEERTSRFRCLGAAVVKDTLALGTPLGEAYPTVIIVERWSMMIVPLGKDERPPPSQIGFFTGAVSLEDGAATRALTVDPSYGLRLFSIRRERLG